MSWKAYFASYSVQSPIHVGYHTISHSERTRYYIPANNMMSAFTYALAGQGRPGGGLSDKVRKSFMFSTFFVSRNGIDALFPAVSETGDLYYGKSNLSLWDFTNQFISAKEAQKYGIGKTLPEMEFIVPRNNLRDGQNYLVGYIFAEDSAEEQGLDSWMRSLRRLSIGEETGNCLGGIELVQLEQLMAEDCRVPFFALDGVFLDWKGDGVRAIYQQPGPLLGYLQGDAEKALTSIYGVKEALEGGFDLLRNAPLETGAKHCWVPGTLVKPVSQGASFRLGSNGIWTME